MSMSSELIQLYRHILRLGRRASSIRVGDIFIIIPIISFNKVTKKSFAKKGVDLEKSMWPPYVWMANGRNGEMWLSNSERIKLELELYEKEDTLCPDVPVS